jgi:hypothetical protein
VQINQIVKRIIGDMGREVYSIRDRVATIQASQQNFGVELGRHASSLADAHSIQEMVLDVVNSNVLSNSGLEVDSDGDGVPDGWSSHVDSGFLATIAKSRDAKHYGYSSLRFSFRNDFAATVKEAYISQAVPRDKLRPGKVHTFGFYYYDTFDDFPFTYLARVIVRDSGGAIIQQEEFHPPGEMTDTPHDFTRWAQTVFIHADAHTVEYQVGVRALGICPDAYVYIDYPTCNCGSVALQPAELVAGIITADHIQAGTIESKHITTKGLVADVVRSGTLCTELVAIEGTDGTLRILDNLLSIRSGGIPVISLGVRADGKVGLKIAESFEADQYGNLTLKGEVYATGGGVTNTWAVGDAILFDGPKQLMTISNDDGGKIYLGVHGGGCGIFAGDSRIEAGGIYLLSGEIGLGSDGRGGYNFRVTPDGRMYAAAGVFDGTVTAAGGSKIGNFDIGTDGKLKALVNNREAMVLDPSNGEMVLSPSDATEPIGVYYQSFYGLEGLYAKLPLWVTSQGSHVHKYDPSQFGPDYYIGSMRVKVGDTYYERGRDFEWSNRGEVVRKKDSRIPVDASIVFEYTIVDKRLSPTSDGVLVTEVGQKWAITKRTVATFGVDATLDASYIQNLVLGSANIGFASIGSAHISDVSADQITTGTLSISDRLSMCVDGNDYKLVVDGTSMRVTRPDGSGKTFELNWSTGGGYFAGTLAATDGYIANRVRVGGGAGSFIASQDDVVTAADSAKSEAITHADTVASDVERSAKVYADTQASAAASTAEQAAKSYAETRASDAESAAKSHADTVATNAEQAAKAHTESYAERKITKGVSQPTSPVAGDLWLDTSVSPNVLRRWSGSLWAKATPTVASEVGAQTVVTSGVAPSSPSLGDLWYDTSANSLKRCTGASPVTWVVVADETAKKTSADTLAVDGAAASTVRSNAASGAKAAGYFSGDGKLNTERLVGDISAAVNKVMGGEHSEIVIDGLAGLTVYSVAAGLVDVDNFMRFSSSGMVLVKDGVSRTVVTPAGIAASAVMIGTDSVGSVLDAWKGTDYTVVDGGRIQANSISTEALRVGSRHNMLNNFSVSGDTTGWSGSGMVGVVDEVTKPRYVGDTTPPVVKTLKVSTSGNAEVISEYIEIDPTVTYRVQLSIYSDHGADTGTRYFGMYAYDDDKTMIAVRPFSVVDRSFGAFESNPYFWSGDVYGGNWRDMTAYILGCNVAKDGVPVGDNVLKHFQLPPNAKYVRIHFLSYYNGGTDVVNHFYSPSIIETSATTISGDQITTGVVNTGLVQIKSSQGTVEFGPTGLMGPGWSVTESGVTLPASATIVFDGGPASLQSVKEVADTAKTTADGASSTANNAKNMATAVGDDLLAVLNGTHAGGTFISGTTVYAPTIAGATGLITGQLAIGLGGILIDGPSKRIYVNDENYMDTSGIHVAAANIQGQLIASQIGSGEVIADHVAAKSIDWSRLDNVEYSGETGKLYEWWQLVNGDEGTGIYEYSVLFEDVKVIHPELNFFGGQPYYRLWVSPICGSSDYVCATPDGCSSGDFISGPGGFAFSSSGLAITAKTYVTVAKGAFVYRIEVGCVGNYLGSQEVSVYIEWTRSGVH